MKLSQELAYEEVKLNNKHTLYFETSKEMKKLNNKYCCISVLLPFASNKFIYVTNFFNILPNEYVLVYTGNGTNRFITKVLDVNFYKEEEMPYPIDKIKIVKQVFDSTSDVSRINELKSIVDKYPPIQGIKYLKQF